MKNEVKGNSSFYPNPVVLASVKYQSMESIITLSWAGTCCSDPPMVSVGVRPERYSYPILKNSGEFVINFPIKSLLDSVKFCGTESGRDYDKWKECNFTKMTSKNIVPPAIVECPVNIECKVEQIIKLGTHDLFIARVITSHVDSNWKLEKYPKMLTYTRGKYGVVKMLE
ncbi:MAG: flavin reductase family protein [Candidatus Hodarchaeales archaeon]|jgi:flavin reductase (DIM6/NTAB) family NADH-FMN oxidoreductase RutF